MVTEGVVSASAAKQILARMMATGEPPDAIASAEGLLQESGSEALQALVDETLSKHSAQVAQVPGGQTYRRGFLVGQVMKASGGRRIRPRSAAWCGCGSIRLAPERPRAARISPGCGVRDRRAAAAALPGARRLACGRPSYEPNALQLRRSIANAARRSRECVDSSGAAATIALSLGHGGLEWGLPRPIAAVLLTRRAEGERNLLYCIQSSDLREARLATSGAPGYNDARSDSSSWATPPHPRVWSGRAGPATR